MSGTVKFLVTSLGLALFCGCQSSRPLTFGLFGVRPDELPFAKGVGASFVVGPQTQEYLRSARNAQLTVIATGDVKLKSDTIDGYYLTDEPDLLGIPPDQVRADYRLAKKKTTKPIFLNLSSAHSIELFQKSCDVVMFDWYPVGWQPVETFYSQVRIARLAANGKPFYAIVQAFSWAEYPKVMAAKPTHRIPTQAEILAMTTWAAMGGASGIAFYPGTNSLSGGVNISSMIENAVEFVRTNEPALRGSRVWTDYPFVFFNGEDKYNAVFEASIAVKITHELKQGLYLVAANTTGKKIEVELARGFEEASGVKRFSFSPLEVKILRLSQGGQSNKQ